MVIQVILPQLGDTMDAGTITHWYKREGERVTQGEPLFQVLTDKANMDVEATTSGFLRKALYAENTTVPAGSVIGYVTTTADEPLEAQGAPAAVETAAKGERSSRAASDLTAAPAAPHRKQFVSPRARRVAREFGIDVSQISPSSPTGRIMEADVRQFVAQRAAAPRAVPVETPAPAPTLPQEGAAPSAAEPATVKTFPPPAASARAAEGIVPITGVRKIIFERMSASAREIARVTLTTDADATRLVELRQELNAHQSEMKFSFTDLLAFLAARAASKHPYINATLHDDGVHQHRVVHLGIATDTERGLVVPVVRDAQQKGLGEIYAELRRLGEAARTAKLTPDELRGGTFTLTNLGQYEIDVFTPIVNQPETAILGIGRIAQKPAAYAGQLALRWMVALSLSFDHRIVDGAPAARFLQQVKWYVETPGLVLI